VHCIYDSVFHLGWSEGEEGVLDLRGLRSLVGRASNNFQARKASQDVPRGADERMGRDLAKVLGFFRVLVRGHRVSTCFSQLNFCAYAQIYFVIMHRNI